MRWKYGEARTARRDIDLTVTRGGICDSADLLLMGFGNCLRSTCDALFFFGIGDGGTLAVFVHLSEELDLQVRCTRGTCLGGREGWGVIHSGHASSAHADDGQRIWLLHPFPDLLVTSADCRLRADCDDTGDLLRDFADTTSTSAVAGIPTRPNMTPPHLDNTTSGRTTTRIDGYGSRRKACGTATICDGISHAEIPETCSSPASRDNEEHTPSERSVLDLRPRGVEDSNKRVALTGFRLDCCVWDKGCQNHSSHPTMLYPTGLEYGEALRTEM